MAILHPVFTIVTLILISFSFLEINTNKKYKRVWIVISIMILLIGLRKVGADYGVYVQMYNYFGINTTYDVVFDKAMFGDAYLDVEWLYVGMGKFFYDLQFPFFVFTLVLAIFSIGLKYFTFNDSVVYPSLSILLYMYPSYLTADGGHMRQAMAMALVIFSFLFIKKRKIFSFLFFIYLAMGFHNSAVIFVFAYWLVLYPLNSRKIIILISLSILLSPFQVYQYISLFDTLAPGDVYKGFQSYEMMEEVDSGRIKFMDLICIMYSYFLITYDKEACNNIPYYEYMRNIGVVGICMYFIFRESPIFSSRLSAYYMVFMVMVLPSIVGAIQNLKLKKGVHLFLLAYVVFYHFVYAIMQSKVGYNIGAYQNYLW